jgi:hypothetical protein
MTPENKHSRKFKIVSTAAKGSTAHISDYLSSIAHPQFREQLERKAFEIYHIKF